MATVIAFFIGMFIGGLIIMLSIAFAMASKED